MFEGLLKSKKHAFATDPSNHILLTQHVTLILSDLHRIVDMFCWLCMLYVGIPGVPRIGVTARGLCEHQREKIMDWTSQLFQLSNFFCILHFAYLSQFYRTLSRSKLRHCIFLHNMEISKITICNKVASPNTGREKMHMGIILSNFFSLLHASAVDDEG